MADGTVNQEPALQGSIEIVRATMKIAVEPWRVLDDATEEQRKAHDKKKCGGKSKCEACVLIDSLYSAQRMCAATANLIARHHERRDGATFEELKLQGEKIKLERIVRDGYALGRAAYPELNAGITAAISKQVEDKWNSERIAILARNERSAARWNADNAPIPLRHADVELVETSNRNRFLLRCTLQPGLKKERRGKQWAIPLYAKDQKAYKMLHAITTGEWRIGQLQLQRDRQKKWYLRIAYKRRVELSDNTVKWAAVNRGIFYFLAVATEDANDKPLLYDGSDIEAHLKQTQDRRKRFQRAYPLSGRKGKGRKKVLAPTNTLAGKTERWRKTRIQTIARRVAQWLASNHVTHLAIEDFSGIRDGKIELLEGGKKVWDRIQTWPYFEMGTRLKACCEEFGIVAVEIDPNWSARTCLKCGHRHEDRKVRRWFNCEAPKCGYSSQIDILTARNQILKARERFSDESEATAEYVEKKKPKRLQKKTARKNGGNSSKS